ncbi:MAG: hypothetical protein GWP10_17940 [Nitrospiraceae bacterium]|nr:hypothetical protein [Nitrospiraceae bacterium]
MDDTGVLLVVGALVLGAVVGFLMVPKPVIVPYVNAGPDISVTECCSTRLTCEGYNPSGGSLTYHWTAKDGKGSFNDASLLHPLYTTPSICGCSDDIVLTLTATNEHGIQASDSMTVRVLNTVSYLPLERCRPITPAPCRVSPVVPSCAAVPVPHCPPQPASACVPVVPYCAPVAPCPPQPARVCVPVVPYCAPIPPLCPPKPQCMDVSSAKSVNEGGSILLRGAVCDPDNNVVQYTWTANKGTFDDPTSLNPIYYAPLTNACEGEYACITLTAVDSYCAQGVDQIFIHINNLNHLPTADAGEDIAIGEGASVQLTCSASDPDGDALSFYWTASRGSFSNPCTLHPVYTAPSSASCADEDVVLTLTVTDACGASASDSMTTHVCNTTNAPPTVKADP